MTAVKTEAPLPCLGSLPSSTINCSLGAGPRICSWMAKMASPTLRASTRWSRRQKVGCVGTGYLPWRLRRIPRARRCAWLKPRANLAISFCPRGAPQRVAKKRIVNIDHSRGRLEMFSLKTAAGVFAQLAAEEAFGLVVFNVVIAPAAAPAVGLAKLAPAAGRINRPAELGDIDEGFDHQHRMAVSALPIGGKPIQGHAQHLARQVGHGTLGQDKESAVVSHQTQAAVALCSAPSDPLVAMLEVLGWSAEEQQRQPLTLGIGST